MSATIRYGDPAEEIADYALSNGVRLIAMSTHGRSGLSLRVFSPVAEKVSQRTSLPMFLIQAPCGSA